MSLENENFELIDRYLNQELSEEERLEFEQKLLKDASLVDEVEAHRAVNALVIDQGLLDIREQLKNYQYKQDGATSFKYIISGGIVLLIAVSLFYYINKDRKVDRIEERFMADTEKVVTPNAIQSSRKKEVKNSGRKQKKVTALNNSPVVNDSIVEKTDTIAERNRSEEILPKENKKFKPYDIARNSQEEVPTVRKDRETCLLTDVSFSFTVTSSCFSSPTGKIKIDFKGNGTPPYLFSLDEKNYRESNSFNNLAGGMYYLTVKDSKGCIGRAEEQIFIESKNCTASDFYFSPSKGEVWALPIENHHSGKIEIFNRAGEIVYTSYFRNGSQSEWNGLTNSGMELPAGIYSYVLTKDKTAVEGTVTIIK